MLSLIILASSHYLASISNPVYELLPYQARDEFNVEIINFEVIE
jgi:hypothetical protein